MRFYVKHGWLKTDKSSLFFKNPNFKTEAKNKFAEDLIKELQEYSPKYPTIKRSKSKDGHLLVLDPADIHVGKLCSILETGKEYNQQIAVRQVNFLQLLRCSLLRFYGERGVYKHICNLFHSRVLVFQ